jgi:hypothetical protein
MKNKAKKAIEHKTNNMKILLYSRIQSEIEKSTLYTITLRYKIP